MKATGVTRKLDSLGRIVIPKELRNALTINENDAMEIFVDEDKVILRKYSNTCIFCDEADSRNLHLFKGKIVCRNCSENISSVE